MPTYREISEESLRLAKNQMIGYFTELRKYNCASFFIFVFFFCMSIVSAFRILHYVGVRIGRM